MRRKANTIKGTEKGWKQQNQSAVVKAQNREQQECPVKNQPFKSSSITT